MNFDKFNEELRTLLTNLVNDGFTQKSISSLTFGANRQDQLAGFLKGRNITGGPLLKIFKPLGFELHIVPICSTSIEERENIDRLTNDALETIQLMMVECLENLKSNSHKKQKSNLAFVADNIIKQINESKKENKDG